MAVGGVNTTFVPGVTCASLAALSGRWTATTISATLNATFIQQAPTPITCSYVANVVQPCCATTAVANVAQTICSGDAFGLATWQTNVESVNPTCIVYSSVTPIAGSVLPNNNLPNGTNGTGPQGLGPQTGRGAWLCTDPEQNRSEERRVGKECRSRWSPYH